MRTNIQHKNTVKTHEGATAWPHMSVEQALRRSVLSCLLWENEFYEDGVSIADRIAALVSKCNHEFVGDLAVEAREVYNLRHAPLWLAVNMNPHSADVISRVIKRADELGEIVSLFWKSKGGRKPSLTAGLKRGLCRAFGKFDEYQIAKYNRPSAVKLKDVVFLAHVPVTDITRKLVADELTTPDTWEVALSGGADKKEAFERLLREQKLGYLALLRNLRNMATVGVDTTLMRDAIIARKGAAKVLPFRFVAAARACPQMEPALDHALLANLSEGLRLQGKTAVLVDVSGSMTWKLSQASDISRMDAAATLASMIIGDVRVFTFSNQVIEVPPRKGMPGVDSIIQSQHHGGTQLGMAVSAINDNVDYDRLIVITDEQSHDVVPEPKHAGYMINVASNKNGVGYGKWVHIDGFSESVLRFIHEFEAVAR